MIYSSAGLLALIITLIINHDVLRGNPEKKLIPAHRAYRLFLMAITVYFLTDIIWGFLYEKSLIALTYADTAVYFLAMAFSILFWTRFVIEYLEESASLSRVLSVTGWVLFVFEIAVIVINFAFPVLYLFDADGVYHAEITRYLTLIAQIIMFLITSIYALASNRAGALRLRHRTIGMSSLVMALFIALQAVYPLLPMYAIGCLLSVCVLHSFVLENEKEEYRDNLEVQLQNSILRGNYYDLLTGLPGMIYFFEDVEKRRSSAENSGGKAAFLYMNFSGLKFYNQEHGFTEGDNLLRSFASLLLSIFGEGNCSRFGQDHFAVFTREEGLTERLKALFGRWQSNYPPILMGVYLDVEDNVDVATVYDRAKLACDSIYSAQVSTVQYYDSAMFTNAERYQYITSHLDQALAEKWVQVYYQPIVRATSGRVCDEEALARWIDPERGFLSPADFIPILEDARLIYKLDLFVVDQVLEKLRRQREAGLFLVPQSINLSRSDFDMCDIVEEIRRRVDDSGLSRKLITIEITESIVGTDFDFIKEQVEQFRSLGFCVWMDDFGSGYSSLDVLQSMPVDLIKLDMRFMQQFHHGDKNRVILTELIRMAIGLGIDTVCEGVEREDQVEFLREIGCSKLQGYYYTKPLPLDEVFRRYEQGLQIGFENPEEADYYDMIGRINLYDLTAIVQEERDSFSDYFNTVPMALIEFRGETVRLTRSNPSYKAFTMKVFDSKLSEASVDFHKASEAPASSYLKKLYQHCSESAPAVFDEIVSNGTQIHAFVRKVAENPLTGATAVAVAILAINSGAKQQG